MIISEKKNCLQEVVRMYDMSFLINETHLNALNDMHTSIRLHIERFSQKVAHALDFFTLEHHGRWKISGSIHGTIYTVTYFKIYEHNNDAIVNSAYDNDITTLETAFSAQTAAET